MRVLTGLVTALLLAFSVLCAVGARFGDQFATLAALGSFAHIAIAAALLALVAALRGNQRVAAVASGLALALNLSTAAPVLSGAGPLPEGAPALKLYMHNVLGNNTRTADVIGHVAATDPDVVVLLEIHKGNREAFRTLDLRYPHRMECWHAAHCDALILSKAPLRDVHIMRDWNEVPLGLARARLAIGQCEVTLFTVHMERPWPFLSWQGRTLQNQQFASLMDAVRGWPGPKVVVGDLNAASWTVNVQRVGEAAGGTVIGGLSGTWPNYVPGPLKLPIDNIIVSRPVLAATREVAPPLGSDHHGVLATIAADLRHCPQ